MSEANMIQRAGWSIAEWEAATGLSRATIYRKIKARQLRTSKVGARRVIIDQPLAWLEQYAAAE